MKKTVLFLSVAALLTGIFSCNKEDKKETGAHSFDRKALLTNYADNYIIPAYNDLSTQLSSLKAAAATLNSNPTVATLQSLQAQYHNAYLTWQKADLLEFGPAEDMALRMYMNIYPASVSKINSNINSGNYNLEAFDNKDAQGFPALNYLLYGTGADENSVAAYFADNTSGAARRKYLTDVIAKMEEKTSKLKTDWATYRDAFVSNSGTDVNSSLSKMVNAFVLYYERYLRSGKIGLPVGAMTGVAFPELCESYYAPQNGKLYVTTALTAIKNFYEGTSYNGASPGSGMKSYLAQAGTKDDDGTLIADLISEKLGAAIQSLNAYNGTIADGVKNNRTAILIIYDQLQEIVPLFKVDMVSAFGISITYTDNDGD